jgi:hypothetical protein
MNNIPDTTTVAFFRERLRRACVIEELFEMFGYTLEIRASKPVVVKSLMPLLFLSQNSATPEKKTNTSILIACQIDGKKTQIDCSRRI